MFGIGIRATGGHESDQPITTFRDRLDEAWLLRIITEDSTQFRDGTRQDVVGHKRVWPDGQYQTFFRNDLTRMRGKEHQHLHHLGFQANSTGRSSDAFSDGST